MHFLRAESANVFITDNDVPHASWDSFFHSVIAPFSMRRPLKVYKTHSGFRSIGMVSFQPPRKSLHYLCEAACDERYISSATDRNRYHCRLTPKWPRLVNESQPFSADLYPSLSTHFSVCSVVLDNTPDNDLVGAFVAFHDQVTKAYEALPLA
jgi:hypothetical protein